LHAVLSAARATHALPASPAALKQTDDLTQLSVTSSMLPHGCPAVAVWIGWQVFAFIAAAAGTQ
jgi:hypothetical protein